VGVQSAAPQSPSIEGLATERWGKVSRYSYYVRFFLVLAILATAAVLVGADPWGPI
jgi:hypothetical protein